MTRESGGIDDIVPLRIAEKRGTRESPIVVAPVRCPLLVTDVTDVADSFLAPQRERSRVQVDLSASERRLPSNLGDAAR